jgi:hypothetical protein
MAFILTRVQVGDYDAWKPMFDADQPGVRKQAKGYRLFRSVENPGEVFVQVEFDSSEDAAEGRQKLLDSGILERFKDHHGPTVVEEAESLSY